MTAAEGGADEVTRSASPETNPENTAGSATHSVKAAAAAGRRGRMPSGFASLRDIMSFGAGLAIISHEVWWSDKIEVALLTVGALLAGLPVVFGADEKKLRPPAE